MPFIRETQRLLGALLLALVAVFSMAAFWAVSGEETILNREDNGRLFEAEAGVIRGDMYDRNGEIIARSRTNPNRIVTRDYLYPAFNGTLGYYSLVYGVDGIEAIYDELLRSADLEMNLSTYLREDVLHIPRQGQDLLLTYDLSVQQVAASLLEGYSGAIVLLSVPDGEIVAMVSNPTYNPNTLDADWDTLIADDSDPFFNRAIQSEFQPGSLFYSPLMLVAYANETASQTMMNVDNSSGPVTVGNLMLECVETPSQDVLSLQTAFLFGCPQLFVQFIDDVSLERAGIGIQRFYNSVADVKPEDYLLPLAEDTEEPAVIDPEDFALADAFGQGEFVISPLAVATISAAIINGGNGPQPFTLLAARNGPDAEWADRQMIRPTIPVTTAEGAALLRNLMLASVSDGSATAAQRPGLEIGGQSAVAIAGDTRMLAWFTGFVVVEGRAGYAVAVLLEDTDAHTLAAEIGGQTLEAAVQSISATE